MIAPIRGPPWLVRQLVQYYELEFGLPSFRRGSFQRVAAAITGVMEFGLYRRKLINTL